MMMTVKIIILNWVQETSAKAEVLLSEELKGNIVCIVVGDNVLFVTAVGSDVALLVFGAGLINSVISGPRVASTKQKTIEMQSIKKHDKLPSNTLLCNSYYVNQIYTAKAGCFAK